MGFSEGLTAARARALIAHKIQRSRLEQASRDPFGGNELHDTITPGDLEKVRDAKDNAEGFTLSSFGEYVFRCSDFDEGYFESLYSTMLRNTR